MALTLGARLGVYEVIAQIGEGGMGQVYRATDTKLKRQVAIKILPPSLAVDHDRLARLQREAEVLASLNHPNIAGIYGLEESGGMTALVMELVVGDDLSQRIARGAIPLDDALPIAKQIAEALEAAHEQGIIHRDLKPANIKVRADGTVKVLDFGLAKILEVDRAGGTSGLRAENLAQSPTITSPAMMTGAGMILGTAAYMSPEQARGKTIDKRADIWAFGCVLFEMLTGRRAFPGEDITDTIVSVVSKTPDWPALPSSTPAAVTSLLRRCLDKDPKRRLRDIGEARVALDGPDVAGPLMDAPTNAPRREGRMAWIASLGVAAVLIAAMALPTLRYLHETPPPSLPEMRTDIVTPATADPISFALSPDGRQTVFVAPNDGASRLWLRPVASNVAQPLKGTEGAQYPFWSPDSRSVGFFADVKLKRLDIGGGAPEVLAAPAAPRGGTWNADGVILYTPNTISPLFRVTVSTRQTVAATKLDRQTSHRFPFFLPDGRQFLFLAQGQLPETEGIYLGSLDSVETQRLTTAKTSGVYLSSGWLLWVREGTLVAQRVDSKRPTLTGDAVSVADPVVSDINLGVSAVSVSAEGLVAYRSGGAIRRQLEWFDRSGTSLGTMGTPDDSLQGPSVSRDGRNQVAVGRVVQGNTDIWLNGTRRFTFDEHQDRFPIWSLKGDIVFDSDRSGQRDLYVSSGAGAERMLLQTDQKVKSATDWSKDGRFILYQTVTSSRDIWVLPLEGDREPWVFLKTGFDERNGQFSPDGRWVAYESNESGPDEIYIKPFASPAASGAAASQTVQVSTAGGIYPRWRADGRELYFIGSKGEMMAASITVTGTTLTSLTPAPLFPTRIYGGGVENAQGRQYDVTRDGRFLINTVLDDAAAPITLLQNWRPDAKK